MRRREPKNIPNPTKFNGDPLDSEYALVETWPVSSHSEAPDYLPEKVERAFVQGQDNLARHHWEAAGMSFRRALEMSTKEKLPGHRGTLKERIDALASTFAITGDLKDFAHHIRLDGNDAAHDFDFTESEAKDIHEFTRLFLMYVYTLPGMLLARKQAKGQTTVRS